MSGLGLRPSTRIERHKTEETARWQEEYDRMRDEGLSNDEALLSISNYVDQQREAEAASTVGDKARQIPAGAIDYAGKVAATPGRVMEWVGLGGMRAPVSQLSLPGTKRGPTATETADYIEAGASKVAGLVAPEPKTMAEAGFRMLGEFAAMVVPIGIGSSIIQKAVGGARGPGRALLARLTKGGKPRAPVQVGARAFQSPLPTKTAAIRFAGRRAADVTAGVPISLTEAAHEDRALAPLLEDWMGDAFPDVLSETPGGRFAVELGLDFAAGSAFEGIGRLIKARRTPRGFSRLGAVQEAVAEGRPLPAQTRGRGRRPVPSGEDVPVEYRLVGPEGQVERARSGVSARPRGGMGRPTGSRYSDMSGYSSLVPEMFAGLGGAAAGGLTTGMTEDGWDLGAAVPGVALGALAGIMGPGRFIGSVERDAIARRLAGSADPSKAARALKRGQPLGREDRFIDVLVGSVKRLGGEEGGAIGRQPWYNPTSRAVERVKLDKAPLQTWVSKMRAAGAPEWAMDPIVRAAEREPNRVVTRAEMQALADIMQPKFEEVVQREITPEMQREVEASETRAAGGFRTEQMARDNLDTQIRFYSAPDKLGSRGQEIARANGVRLEVEAALEGGDVDEAVQRVLRTIDPGASASPIARSHSLKDVRALVERTVREFASAKTEYRAAQEAHNALKVRHGESAAWGAYATKGGKDYSEVVITMPEVGGGDIFRSESHWPGIDNPVVHIRSKTHKGPMGENVRFVEEIQSDWAQGTRGAKDADEIAAMELELRQMEGRANKVEEQRRAFGYARDLEETPEILRLDQELNKLTDDLNSMSDALRDAKAAGVAAPAGFRESADWQALGLKRALDDAIAGDHKALAWTSGDMQAQRNNLGNYVDELDYGPTYEHEPRGYTLRGIKDNDVAFVHDIEAEEDLVEYVGKDLADRLIKDGSVKNLDDQFVGKNWAHIQYDETMPRLMNKMLKRLGVKERVRIVEMDFTSNVETAGYPPAVDIQPVPYLEITPELRKAVQGIGLARSGRAGALGRRYLTQEAQSVGRRGLTPNAEASFAAAVRLNEDVARALTNLETGNSVVADQVAKMTDRPMSVVKLDPGLGLWEGNVNANRIYTVEADDEQMDLLAAFHGIIEGQDATNWFRRVDLATAPAGRQTAKSYVIHGPDGMDAKLTDDQIQALFQAIHNDPELSAVVGGATAMDGRIVFTNFDNSAEYVTLLDRAVVAAGLAGKADLARTFTTGAYLEGLPSYLRSLSRDPDAIRFARARLGQLQPVYEAFGRTTGVDPVAVRQRFDEQLGALDATARGVENPPPEGRTTGITVLEAARDLSRRWTRLRSSPTSKASIGTMEKRAEEMLDGLAADLGWDESAMRDFYKRGEAEHRAVAQGLIPELREDSAFTFYTILTSIASNGQEVVDETRLGLNIFENFLNTGELSMFEPGSAVYQRARVLGKESGLPISKPQYVVEGKRATGLAGESVAGSPRVVTHEQAFQVLQVLYDDAFKRTGDRRAAMRDVVEYLLAEPVTIGRGAKQRKAARMTELFGDKIGQYALDKLGISYPGIEHKATIDVWMTRLYYALRGENPPTKVDGKTGMTVLDETVYPGMRESLNAVIGRVAKSRGIPVSSAQAISWFGIKNAFRKAGAKEKGSAYHTMVSAIVDAATTGRKAPKLDDLSAGVGKDVVEYAARTTGWGSERLQTLAKRTDRTFTPERGAMTGTSFGNKRLLGETGAIGRQAKPVSDMAPVREGRENLVSRMALTDPELEGELRNVINALDPEATRTITWAQTRAEAAKILRTNSPEDLIGMDPKRMTGADALATASMVRDRLDRMDVMIKQIDELNAKGGDSVDLQLQLTVMESDVNKLLRVTMKGMSEHGRSLNAAKILANIPQDPNLWLMRAKRLLPEGEHLTTEQMKLVEGLVNTIAEASTKAERDAAQRKLMEFMIGLQHTPGLSKFIAFWRAGLLTLPGGRILDVVGTTGHMITEQGAVAVPKAMLDRLISLATGQRTATLPSMARLEGWQKGAREGMRTVYKIYGGEALRNAPAGAKFETWLKEIRRPDLEHMGKWIDVPRHIRFETAWLDAYVQLAYKGAAAPDGLIRPMAELAALDDRLTALVLTQKKAGTFKGNVADEVHRMISKGEIPPEIVAEAKHDASLVLFIEDNGLSKAIGDFRRSFRKHGGAFGEAVFDFLMPFKRVPSNVAMRSLEYTPAGFALWSVKDSYQLYKAIQRGADDATIRRLQRRVVDVAARAGVGSGLAVIGAWMYMNGRLTQATWPEDPREQAAWRESGRKPGSILIKDEWVPIIRLAPVGVALAVGAQVAAMAERGGFGVATAAAETGKAALGIVSEMPMMRGMEPIQALTDPNKSIARIAQQYAGSMVPSGIAGLSRELDPSTPAVENRGAENLWGMPEAMAARIPGVSNLLPNRRTGLGQTYERRRAGGNLTMMRGYTDRSQHNDVVRVLAILDATPGLRRQGKGLGKNVLKELIKAGVPLPDEVRKGLQGLRESGREFEARVTGEGLKIHAQLNQELGWLFQLDDAQLKSLSEDEALAIREEILKIIRKVRSESSRQMRTDTQNRFMEALP